MTTWVKEHFSDSNQALTTLSSIAAVVGVVGFVLVMVGVFLAR